MPALHLLRTPYSIFFQSIVRVELISKNDKLQVTTALPCNFHLSSLALLEPHHDHPLRLPPSIRPFEFRPRMIQRQNRPPILPHFHHLGRYALLRPRRTPRIHKLSQRRSPPLQFCRRIHRPGRLVQELGYQMQQEELRRKEDDLALLREAQPLGCGQESGLGDFDSAVACWDLEFFSFGDFFEEPFLGFEG